MNRPTAGAAMGGGRAFVDATGTPVPLRGPVRRVVATDPDVGGLLLELGATVVGCAGGLDGVEEVGGPGAPDPRAVAAVHPDAVVTGTVGGRHDLADPALLGRLREVAPVIAVDLERRAATAADLRALLGPVQPPPHRSRGRHED
jgi:ABC-type Fe3+-hydroxamate transport system substrate-binding protein